MSDLDLQKTKEIVVVQPLINEIMNEKKKVDHEKIRDLLDLFRELKKENLGSNNIKQIITKNIQSLRKKQADLGEEIVLTAEQGKKLALVGGRKKTKKRMRRASRIGKKKRKTSKSKKSKKIKKSKKSMKAKKSKHSGKTHKKRKTTKKHRRKTSKKRH